MIIIISVLISLSIICVTLRIFARVKRRIGFGIDDYLCFAATIFLISMLIELVLCKFLMLRKRNVKKMMVTKKISCHTRVHYWGQW